MPKPTTETHITDTTIKMAIRDARDGVTWEHTDPECKGLILRVRGGAVSWTFRGPRIDKKQPRWVLGDHRVAPPEARRRAWEVRGRIQNGQDPDPLVVALVTGVAEPDQVDMRVKNKPSWEWSDAIARYLLDLASVKRQATYDDYRGTLRNTPELQHFVGRQVCDILREEVMEAVEKVRKRGVKTHHKKILIVTRCFFNWLGDDARRRQTSVPENFLLGAKASAAMRDVPGRRVMNKGIPESRPIGRALAIARSGVLGFLPSVGIMMVMGTVSRRRGVVEINSNDWKPYHAHDPKIYVWFQPPASRKTADRIQSSDPHQVPLVGWVASLIDDLERCRPMDDETGWLFPVARPRHAGVPPKTEHMDVGTLNHNMDAMPGVYGNLSPHALRRAIASYGKKVGGFADGEVKMLLDHLEGKGADVTRGHYDLDPRMERKVEMMTWWTGWLDEQYEEAIRADPMLLDKEALRQAIYIKRYGQEKWDAKLSKTRKTGTPLWQTPRKVRPTISL